MITNQRYEMLVQFQARTAIFNTNECVRILEQFHWNCLDAVNYVLENVDSTKQRPLQRSRDVDQSFIPNECLDEVEGIRHFERVFQARHPNVSRWPVWFKASLENAINQSHGPFAIYLNHDGSPHAKTFARQILCSPSILNVFMFYKCILWPWDITESMNKQRFLERSGRARQVLSRCLSYFTNINSYPLLLILTRRKDRVVLLDFVNGNCDFDQTRACLERTLNPDLEQSIISVNENTSLSPGWVGGRTVGNIHRRPSFLTSFRLSRPLRAVQRPHYILFYQREEPIPEIIVSCEEAKQWLNQTNSNNLTPHSSNNPRRNLSYSRIKISSSEHLISPIPSLDLPNKSQHSFVHMSPRRAGWAPWLTR